MGNLREDMKNGAAELDFHFGAADWRLVRILPGQFTMGTPLDEPGRESWELAPRRFRITRPFYMAKYEATNAQYRAVMGPQTHSAPGDEELPFGQARFRDALEFCASLAKQLGVAVTLPTEAQWEYSCRAGTGTPYFTGSAEADLQRAAWYVGNSGGSVHRGCEKEMNQWGLCDMLGNVAEPCLDYVLAPEKLSETDPVGRVGPEYGCVRGGSWMDTAPHCRAGYRLRTRDRLAGLGIRIVINP
jgi:formylglycine-generating enzyme required for sulfatase activity